MEKGGLCSTDQDSVSWMFPESLQLLQGGAVPPDIVGGSIAHFNTNL